MRPSLLIADRDVALCERYRQFLDRGGYEVETAAGGLECLARLRRGPVSAVVLDLELPWGGGDGVLAWLRDEPGVPRPPVVLLTSDGGPATALDHLGPPVVACLRKPCHARTVLDCIETVLGSVGAAG